MAITVRIYRCNEWDLLKCRGRVVLVHENMLLVATKHNHEANFLEAYGR
jgi:hypothetical protein